MRYRLAMARALLGGPDLLILDEPTTGMDPAQIREVHAVMAACAEAGATIVFSTHQMSEVELVCSHAAILRAGRLVATGSVAELVGTLPRVRLELDDREGGMAVLQGLPGVSQATASGPRSVTVEGDGLRPFILLEALHAAGCGVSSFRSNTFEDSYLELFAADPPPGPLGTR